MQYYDAQQSWASQDFERERQDWRRRLDEQAQHEQQEQNRRAQRGDIRTHLEQQHSRDEQERQNREFEEQHRRIVRARQAQYELEQNRRPQRGDFRTHLHEQQHAPILRQVYLMVRLENPQFSGGYVSTYNIANAIIHCNIPLNYEDWAFQHIQKISRVGWEQYCDEINTLPSAPPATISMPPIIRSIPDHLIHTAPVQVMPVQATPVQVMPAQATAVQVMPPLVQATRIHASARVTPQATLIPHATPIEEEVCDKGWCTIAGLKKSRHKKKKSGANKSRHKKKKSANKSNKKK